MAVTRSVESGPIPRSAWTATTQIAGRHGCHLLRGLATYADVYKLTCVRGPTGIIVMFAEELKGT